MPESFDGDIRYGKVAMSLHWLMVLLLPAQAAIGLAMTRMPIGLDQFLWYGRHKSFGVILLGLALARWAWRLICIPPALSGQALDIRAAKVVHVLLYATLTAVPMTGWMMASASNTPVSIFGLVTLPDLVPPDRELRATLKAAHAVSAALLAGLVVVHVAGAVRHILRGDGTIRRMLPRKIWSAAS
ncbi:MAG: cytochrome b [Rhodospirillaceae bacterium]|nr:cytochrome b [Rhodospirillaceae bacterium]